MSAARQLRGVAHRAVAPLVRALTRRGVSPNTLTLGSTAVSAAGGAALAAGAPPALLGGALLLRLLLDVLDGEVARAGGRTSRVGAMLNDLGDGLDDVLLYAGLAWGTATPAILLFAALGAASELTALAAAAQGAPRLHHGPLGKVERMAVMAVASGLVTTGHDATAWVLAGCALAALTGVRRAVAGARALR